MKRAPAAWSIAAWVLLSSSAARALEVHPESTAPVPVGQANTFRIGEVKDAEGAVTYRWNFGDGTIVGPGAAGEVEHSYASAGHYTIIALATDSAGQRTSTSWTQTAYLPATELPPSNSSSVLFDAARNRIWSVNQDNDSVTVSDGATLNRELERAVGDEPRMLAQAADGAIWVTNQHSDEIVILDPADASELARVALPYASQPHSVAFGPSGKAYVSLFATGELLEIDASTRELGRRLALGPTPAAIAVASDGRIFVTRFISPEGHGELWVVEPNAFQLARTIELLLDPGPDSESAGRGVPNYVSSVVISPDGTQAWVTAKKDDTVRGPQRDGLPMNPDNFVRAIVCVIDLASESERLDKRLDVDNRALPAAVAFSPLGDLAYVLHQASNWLGIFDAYGVRDLSGIKDIGKAPDGLAFDGNGKLFVNSFLTREVFVYDLTESLASRDHQAPPPLARIPSVGEEVLPAEVLLGKQVFNDAADKRMSEVGYMSCSTCHFAGMSDGRIWDFTDRGEGLRNTKPLLGFGAPGQGRIHWSANFDEIQDFERDIRESLGGTGFMSNDDWLAHQPDTFGEPSAGFSPELDALATYVMSLTETAKSPYRNADGSFSAEARRGRQVFEKAGCPMCHAAPTFTNSETGNLYDVGTTLPSSGQRLGGDLTGFDTPTLKGLWQSAPYLHDGRAATLADVFTIAGDEMGTVSTLSEREQSEMVRYLLELDDVPEAEPAHSSESSEDGGLSCSFGAPSAPPQRGFWLLALSGLFALRKLSSARPSRSGTSRYRPGCPSCRWWC
jgi:DNA-binding beta-propeller fold protein YncE